MDPNPTVPADAPPNGFRDSGASLELMLYRINENLKTILLVLVALLGMVTGTALTVTVILLGR
jgi:hypothetical protein